MKIGAQYLGYNKCRFTVWCPWADNIKVHLISAGSLLQLQKKGCGYWGGEFDNIPPGTKYLFRINNGIERPDPASNFQPTDVHSASEVVDHSSYEWNEKNWHSPALKDYIIYEMHPGTFTTEGSFNAAAKKINHLKELGITAVEIMPVSQYPGDRNWGYDGVYPFAPQNNYGKPDELKNFINVLHQNKIAAILDVVYNHFGPEGNYLHQYGPYFSSAYNTPWGQSINFDGEYSDEVRNYFLQNALHWFGNYHFDALRLDAIDKIIDLSAKHFLRELAEEAKEFSAKSGKQFLLIAESDLNDEKIIRPLDERGFGLNAQWSDDFHHSLHSLVTLETTGYYSDFTEINSLTKSLKDSFVYDGIYSEYRKRNHGNSVSERNLDQFIVNIQNHDQVGNRAFGERLSVLTTFEGYKLASAVLLMNPSIPLIFMGQEFYEKNPFLFFISHSDPELIKAVQKGRREEFASFRWEGEIPDPFSEETYKRSKLNWDFNSDKESTAIFALYKELIKYRKKNPVFFDSARNSVDVKNLENKKVILLHRHSEGKSIYCVMNLEPGTITVPIDVPSGNWQKIFDTSHERWHGPGISTEDSLIGKTQNMTLKGESFILYEQE